MSLHIREAAPAYAANTDAAFWDLWAVIQVITSVLELPLDRLDALIDHIESAPQHVEFMTVRQLMLLVQETRS